MDSAGMRITPPGAPSKVRARKRSFATQTDSIISTATKAAFPDLTVEVYGIFHVR